MREKTLIIFLCVIGALAVFYGMMKDNNVVFVIGLLFVIAGYLLIRRRLKESIRNKS
ncbi:MAG: LPXTG cell wall anchor domain-containing protein [Deltaproteobacteria bacterium]|nr:MAG: LPXTG cell wall anchor domain-containing protein [Deltaproteobacteria bacterium]